MHHRRHTLCFNYGLALLALCFSTLAWGAEWKQLSPGLEYKTIQPVPELKSGIVHAFRADLAHYRLILAFPSKTMTTENVEQLTKDHHALLGINGGFFDQRLQSLGLRVNDQVIKNPLRRVSWWGVFYIQNKKAHIVSQRKYAARQSIEFAIQSGPRLLIHGKIPALKPGIANRTALGITQSGKVIILATENLPLTTHELALLMRQPEAQNGLNCRDAINLDGGTSTQLYAQIDQFKLKVTGLKHIADAVLLVAR